MRLKRQQSKELMRVDAQTAFEILELNRPNNFDNVRNDRDYLSFAQPKRHEEILEKCRSNAVRMKLHILA